MNRRETLKLMGGAALVGAVGLPAMPALAADKTMVLKDTQWQGDQFVKQSDALSRS